MQKLNCGSIENLVVRDGEPIFDPLPKITKSIILADATRPRAEFSEADFTFKREFIGLFRVLDRVGTGTIDLLEVQDGLPIRMRMDDTGTYDDVTVPNRSKAECLHSCCRLINDIVVLTFWDPCHASLLREARRLARHFDKALVELEQEAIDDEEEVDDDE